VQHAAKPINGVSPREPNPRLGCEMLKTTRALSPAAGRRGVNLGLTTTGALRERLIARAMPFETRGAETCAKNTPKRVTSVDNVMTQA
jgi:hypothetical protein